MTTDDADRQPTTDEDRSPAKASGGTEPSPALPPWWIPVTGPTSSTVAGEATVPVPVSGEPESPHWRPVEWAAFGDWRGPFL